VLTPDGRPALDEAGHVAVPDQPKIREDLRTEVSAQQIEIVRQGLWKVVNEKGGPGGGGTGAKGQVKGVVVAGKTGTAQATERGKKEHIGWFCSFAPFDHPKFVVVAMVQGGEHGGGVAAPIAAHIMDQCLALDQGTYQVKLEPLAPAHSDHPFQAINALTDYKDASPVLAANADEESPNAQDSSAQSPQMERSSAKPDIRPEADSQGRVIPRAQRAQQAKDRAEQPQPQDRRNLFQKFFHSNQKAAPAPQPAQPQQRRPHWPF
jgi:penicillin-binding protein 2